MGGAAGRTAEAGDRIPCQSCFEEATGLPEDARRHRYSLPSGRAPFRPFDSATAGPIRSATPQYQSGHSSLRGRTDRAHMHPKAPHERYTPDEARVTQAGTEQFGEGRGRARTGRADPAVDPGARRGYQKIPPIEAIGGILLSLWS